MVWTAPRTWTAGEVVTASIMNAHVRDDLNALRTPAVATKTAAYIITDADDVIRCDATTAAFIVTLPTAVGITGRRFEIKKIDATANAVTVDGNGAETIDGALTFALTGQYDAITVRSNGTGWDLV